MKMTQTELTCVYCGHKYPNGTPSHGAQILTDHIKVCEKHPMSELQRENADLKIALRESVKLQAHYAGLLNQWDGGKRMIFESAEEWIARLRETKTL